MNDYFYCIAALAKPETWLMGVPAGTQHGDIGDYCQCRLCQLANEENQ